MKLPERVTFDEAAALSAQLPAALQQQAGSGAFTLDASALKQYDTATISLLLQARRLAAAAGRGFVVQGTPAQLLGLAQLYGVAELLGSP